MLAARVLRLPEVLQMVSETRPRGTRTAAQNRVVKYFREQNVSNVKETRRKGGKNIGRAAWSLKVTEETEAAKVRFIDHKYERCVFTICGSSTVE